MTTLIRAELLKLRTLRSTWWLAVASTAFVAAVTVGTILEEGAPGGALDAGEPGIRSIMGSAQWAPLFAMLLGAMVVTGEFRSGTATATFLTAPRRARVLLAKAAGAAAAGAVLGALAIAVTGAIAVPWLTSAGFDVDLLDASTGGVLAGCAASAVVSGVLGLGIGALVPHQAAAVTVALLWTFVAEPTLAGVVPHVYPWLPAGAEAALVGWDGALLLPVWGGGLVLAGWAAVLAALGSAVAARRDLH